MSGAELSYILHAQPALCQSSAWLGVWSESLVGDWSSFRALMACVNMFLGEICKGTVRPVSTRVFPEHDSFHVVHCCKARTDVPLHTLSKQSFGS